MKLPTFLLALTITGLAWAQDPAPPAEATPAEATPAEPTPAEPAPAPAAEPKPLAEPTELPPLPDPSPNADPSELMRNQPGSRLTPAPRREPSLLPDRVPPPIKAPERPKNTSTLRPPQTSADLDARIRFRQAHSRALNDPAIQAIWHESRVARTDYRKRDALRRYYTTLYSRMLRFDKGIAPLVEDRRRVSLRRLDQTRIDPTDPLDEEHRQRLDY